MNPHTAKARLAGSSIIWGLFLIPLHKLQVPQNKLSGDEVTDFIEGQNHIGDGLVLVLCDIGRVNGIDPGAQEAQDDVGHGKLSGATLKSSSAWCNRKTPRSSFHWSKVMSSVTLAEGRLAGHSLSMFSMRKASRSAIGGPGLSWDAPLIGVLSDVKGEEGAEAQDAEDDDDGVKLH
jgi:hypothetical protein